MEEMQERKLDVRGCHPLCVLLLSLCAVRDKVTVGPRLSELLDGLLEPLAEDRLTPQEALDIVTGALHNVTTPGFLSIHTHTRPRRSLVATVSCLLVTTVCC